MLRPRPAGKSYILAGRSQEIKFSNSNSNEFLVAGASLWTPLCVYLFICLLILPRFQSFHDFSKSGNKTSTETSLVPGGVQTAVSVYTECTVLFSLAQTHFAILNGWLPQLLFKIVLVLFFRQERRKEKLFTDTTPTVPFVTFPIIVQYFDKCWRHDSWMGL